MQNFLPLILLSLGLRWCGVGWKMTLEKLALKVPSLFPHEYLEYIRNSLKNDP